MIDVDDWWLMIDIEMDDNKSVWNLPLRPWNASKVVTLYCLSAKIWLEVDDMILNKIW